MRKAVTSAIRVPCRVRTSSAMARKRFSDPGRACRCPTPPGRSRACGRSASAGEVQSGMSHELAIASRPRHDPGCGGIAERRVLGQQADDRVHVSALERLDEALGRSRGRVRRRARAESPADSFRASARRPLYGRAAGRCSRMRRSFRATARPLWPRNRGPHGERALPAVAAAGAEGPQQTPTRLLLAPRSGHRVPHSPPRGPAARRGKAPGAGRRPAGPRGAAPSGDP